MEFFLNPERLWHLAWVIPVIVALFFSAQARRKNALRKLLGATHFVQQEGVPVGVNASPTKRFIRFLLFLICTSLLVGAYARPAWKTEIVPFRGAGRDVAIALDLSKSMRSEDVKPSRLIHAKRFISDMTARMKGDRFALVAFAGDAFLSCPLTFDSVSFKLILDGEQIGSVPVGGTNIERALQVSESAFDAAEVSGHCAIVLVSDGGELTGNMAREAEKLRAAKIPVVVVGVGDPVAVSPIPEPNEEGRIEYLKGREGNVVNTRLEEGPLRELAAKTGGIYIRSTLTEMNDDVAAEWIRRLTPAAQEEGMRSIPIERRSWFLIPAIVAFFLFLALGERIRNERGLRAKAFKTLLKSAPILAFAVLVFSSPRTLFAQGEEEKFTGTSAEEYFNEALKAQKEGDSERARKLYAEALAQKNALKGTRTAISQNLGAQLHEDARAAVSQAEGTLATNADEAGKMADSAESNFKRAEEFYRDVLRSGDLEFSEGTAQNERILLNDLKHLEELKKQIEEQKKQQQQQDQNSGESQNQDQQQQQQNSDQNQDQDKQDQQKNSDQSQDQQNQNQQNQNEQNQQQDQQEQNSQGNEEQNQDSQDQKNSPQQDEQKGDSQKDREENNASPDNKEQGDDQKDDASDKNSSGQQDQSLEHEEKSKANDSKENENGRGNGAQPKEESFDDTAAEMVLREMRNEEEARREEILKEMRGKERHVERDW